MRELLSGCIATGLAVVALHFLRFWRQSGERLFAMFGAAFAIMCVNHVALAFVAPDDESRVAIYGLRLVAFAMILVALVRANRAR